MNYLSHFYFDRSASSAEYILGCAMPDLLSGYKRKLKAKSIDPTPNDFPQSLIELQCGINRHHELDALFHNSVFFEKETNKIEVILKKQVFESIDKHFYFYAHILLELLLDRKLLKEQFGLVDQFYQKLAAADIAIIGKYLSFRGFDFHQTSFMEFYGFFLKRQFVRDYKKDDMMIKALNQIHLRIQPNEIIAADLFKIKKALALMEENIELANFESVLL